MTHYDDVVGMQHMEFDVDNYILMNLGAREQSWAYAPTGTICPMLARKALGNYYLDISLKLLASVIQVVKVKQCSQL